jgi:hypothetical protein
VSDTVIASAKTGASSHCAIAQGVGASIPGVSHITVDIATIRFTIGEKRMYYHTPSAVQRFILAFDNGEDVKPFTFTLRDGTVHNVARRPGVGGRPKGSKTVNRGKAVVSHPGRRTYGARSMTPTAIVAAANRALSHA